MSDELKLDLDPKKVLQAMADMSLAMKALASDIEQALGKEAPKSIKKTEDAAEKGSSKIKGIFANLGKQLKEDMKTAFALETVAGGLKFAESMAAGVKEVFNLERAFDKLNTRLKLTGKEFSDFKSNIGTKIASTGQKLEDVFPGVETASAKGGVKSPQELASIGEALGKVRAATGESTDALADSVVEIVKSQGKKVNSKSFGETLDMLQATRVSGAFKTAAEAGHAIEQISPYGKMMNLSGRELGGMAATASKSGVAGQDILRQLMEQASRPGGKDKLNGIFGVDLFKNGKLDPAALGKINTSKFGQNSQQVMEQATGLSGASGTDLTRFVDAFKNNMGDFNTVVSGANETAAQFATATDSMAASFDKFRENTKNATREIGDTLSTAAHDLAKGNLSAAAHDIGNTAKSAWDNKGTLAVATASTVGMSILMGGAANHLLKKLPGGKMLGGLVGEGAAEAAGVQKVFVVNASEMGGSGAGGVLAGAGGKLGKFAGMAGGALAAGAIGYEIGASIMAAFPKLANGGESIYNALHPDEASGSAKDSYSKQDQASDYNKHNGTALTVQEYEKAVHDGTLRAQVTASKNKPVQMTNPSDVTKRGGRG